MKLYTKHIVAKLFSASILKIKLSPKLKMSQKLFDLIYFCFSGFTWIEMNVLIFYRFWIFFTKKYVFWRKSSLSEFHPKKLYNIDRWKEDSV